MPPAAPRFVSISHGASAQRKQSLDGLLGLVCEGELCEALADAAGIRAGLSRNGLVVVAAMPGTPGPARVGHEEAALLVAPNRRRLLVSRRTDAGFTAGSAGASGWHHSKGG
ncbi:unnamed protein product [Tilletia caries]|uniref:Uncharacterized protein n=1 Tax=Tilletia caries TaxID=13290 RepID=A0ABN7ITD2_9BASI|nr:unnamed protein product [Tilletia caries]